MARQQLGTVQRCQKGLTMFRKGFVFASGMCAFILFVAAVEFLMTAALSSLLEKAESSDNVLTIVPKVDES